MTLRKFLGFFDFDYYVEETTNGEKIIKLIDEQGADFGDIECERFHSPSEIIARLESYYHDYLYQDIRENHGYQGKEDYAEMLEYAEDNQIDYKDILYFIVNGNELVLEEDSYEKFFEGYNVPAKIKYTAIAIQRRFIITGVCDGMYICNRIAVSCGIGDGNGNFYSDQITNFSYVAKYLQAAYASNIPKEDLHELEYILEHGRLDNRRAVKGIRMFINKCRKESQDCEKWRKEYLDHLIRAALYNLASIQ